MTLSPLPFPKLELARSDIYPHSSRRLPLLKADAFQAGDHNQKVQKL